MLNATGIRSTVETMMAAKAYQAATIRALLFAQRGTPTPYGINSSSLVQSFASLYDKVASNGLSKQVTLVPHEPSTYTGALTSQIVKSLRRASVVLTRSPNVPCCASLFVLSTLSSTTLSGSSAVCLAPIVLRSELVSGHMTSVNASSLFLRLSRAIQINCLWASLTFWALNAALWFSL